MSIKYTDFFALLIILSLIGCSSSDDDNNTGLSLSGRIFVASNTATDGDVNDSSTREISNNTTSRAQSIPNPVILGGYVNQPGTGPSGRFKNRGDTDDFFEVDLRRGQTIRLFIANQNFSSNDLDLGLLNMEGLILNSSVGTGKAESLTVPADGRYFVQIQAHSGAANYVLTIGQNLIATSHGMRLSDEFAPGEIIVQFSSENTLQAQSLSTSLGMQTQSSDTSRRMLFTLDSHQWRTLTADNLKFANPEHRAKHETLLAIKKLRKRSDIIEASPNYQLQTLRVPDDDLYRYQWNYDLINLPQAWDTTIGDSSVIVAVVDSGVLLNHPDLEGKLVQGYDFVANRNTEVDGDGGIDSNPDDPGDQSPRGSSFHGTHVAGIVAALTNNNEGIAGVGWKTSVMPLRAIGKGEIGFDYDIEQAIRFSAGLSNDSGKVPTKRADIINLSLGGPAISPGFQQLINQVRNAGVIVVAAAGNEDTSTPSYPAALDGVVSVSAVDITKKRASYSNFGRTIDVAAPGGDNMPDINGDGIPDGILSTVGDDQYGSWLRLEFSYRSYDGTSMAAPHVAGVISLMKAIEPTLTPQDLDHILRSGKITDDLGTAERDDYFGYGLINAQKAVLAAVDLTGNVIPQAPPQLIVNPKSLNFGVNRISAILTINNGGGGDLRIENIIDDSGGFLSWEGNGLGDYIVRIDRSRLGTGTFTATITVISNANTVKIPVILQVGRSDATGDAGLHYILLVNPSTLETVRETRATVRDGIYYFNFNDVPEGAYFIVAGNDFNNNDFICDVGEACGVFPTIDRPTPIEIAMNRKELDFSTGFNVNFLSQSSRNTKIPLQGFALLKKKRSIATQQ
jgi:serine protease